ncbi:hypothetical protein [Gilliamella sp. App6-5]|uniref:hypothetical protein n=1 Tax=Gilliamella sp. App6-5 TaxID=3120232 RepID=UPI00080E1609|nr:hypothetical protein [Gilliamella apicola]
MPYSLDSQANSRTVDNHSDAIILPPSIPILHFARPNLLFGKNGAEISGVNFAGPANIWNPEGGFLIQSTNGASYDLNFPTTGADGLYFDLVIEGIDARQLIWEPVTHGGITAIVTWIWAEDDWLPSGGEIVTRVTLKGPEANAQINNPHPNRIAVPSLPQIFELVGRDVSTGNELVKYGFVLQKWFVNRGDKEDNYPNTEAWCSDLGYRVPQVRDLTNAVCLGTWEGDWCKGSVGATPSSSGNHYQRRIGAGFFTEWGGTYLYAEAGFVYDYQYWTSDTTGNTQFDVDSDVGDVYFNQTSNSPRGICATP